MRSQLSIEEDCTTLATEGLGIVVLYANPYSRLRGMTHEGGQCYRGFRQGSALGFLTV